MFTLITQMCHRINVYGANGLYLYFSEQDLLYGKASILIEEMETLNTLVVFVKPFQRVILVILVILVIFVILVILVSIIDIKVCNKLKKLPPNFKDLMKNFSPVTLKDIEGKPYEE